MTDELDLAIEAFNEGMRLLSESHAKLAGRKHGEAPAIDARRKAIGRELTLLVGTRERIPEIRRQGLLC